MFSTRCNLGLVLVKGWSYHWAQLAQRCTLLHLGMLQPCHQLPLRSLPAAPLVQQSPVFAFASDALVPSISVLSALMNTMQHCKGIYGILMHFDVTSWKIVQVANIGGSLDQKFLICSAGTGKIVKERKGYIYNIELSSLQGSFGNRGLSLTSHIPHLASQKDLTVTQFALPKTFDRQCLKAMQGHGSFK